MERCGNNDRGRKVKVHVFFTFHDGWKAYYEGLLETNLMDVWACTLVEGKRKGSLLSTIVIKRKH